MWRSGRSMRALVGGLAWLLCIGLLVSVAIEGGSNATPSVVAAAAADARMVPSRARLRDNRHLDPLLGSKRRVPNGPDPIHNRRAGKSGRPPGRA